MMYITENTFNGFPSLRVWRLRMVWFQTWKFNAITDLKIETKNGTCDMSSLNVGKLFLSYEKPVKSSEVAWPQR